MRWSLILSFIAFQSAFSVVCVALTLPPSSDGLERRTSSGSKESSKQYRANAKLHHDAYDFKNLGPTGKITPAGTVTKKRLDKGARVAHTEDMLKNSKIPLQADHIFEDQMLHKHLGNHGHDFKNLPVDLKKKVKKIMNHPQNMAFIPASINSSKGQLIKQGLAGKEIKRKKPRDDYARLSYGTARKTAKKLDKAFKKHGITLKDSDGQHDGFHSALHKTFVNAGLFNHGHPSPGSSSGSSRPSSSTSSRSSSSKSSKSSSPNPRKRKAGSPASSRSSPDPGRSSPKGKRVGPSAGKAPHVVANGKKRTRRK